jgi:hypothetical protein
MYLDGTALNCMMLTLDFTGINLLIAVISMFITDSSGGHMQIAIGIPKRKFISLERKKKRINKQVLHTILF